MSSTPIPRERSSSTCSGRKSSPTGPTTLTSVKKLAASAKCTAEPPSMRSRSPNGVRTESNAIEPTTVSDMRPCILSGSGLLDRPRLRGLGAGTIAFPDMGVAAKAEAYEARAAGPSFHAIGDYGFLSDCHTGALVASDGTVEWMCLRRFDSPSIFAAVLDRNAGAWRLGPRGLRAPVARRYVPGTNVLETSWMTSTGWFIVRDALTLAPAGDEDGMDAHARDLGPHDAEHLLIRTVECVHGRV